MSLGNVQRSGIKVLGHYGKWYIIDETYFKGEKAYLLEHETYGDETGCLIVRTNLDILLEDVQNGLSELKDESAIYKKRMDAVYAKHPYATKTEARRGGRTRD